MINWILQKNLTKPEVLLRIKNALTQKDESWEEIEMIPFSNEMPIIKNPNAFPIIYGSTSLMLTAFNDPKYKKGVFYDPKRFNMQNYANHWGHFMLNQEGFLSTFGEIENLKSLSDEKWFVRPNHDGKEFGGRVLTFKDLKEWSQKVIHLNLPDLNARTEIWLSKPKEIEKEWRVFIVDDQLISISRYMQNGELDESDSDIPKEMIEFTQNRISEYHLAPIYVMDIAQVDKEFKIIECNCFNGTGFYKHDIEAVVMSINESIRKKIKKELNHMSSNHKLNYILQLGDNALILGQRLSEWCGHGPVLEQDIAITNMALDLLGQARNWMDYAAQTEGKNRTEDELAFTRNEWEYRNVLLVEYPNKDWAFTIVRQFLFDAFNYYIHKELTKSQDEHIAAIAAKSLKEITYHLRFSSEWVIRLGDGTEVSHEKMQKALDELWRYKGELFEFSETDREMISNGIGADLNKIKPLYDQKLKEIFEEATLKIPDTTWSQSGGKTGKHSENLGHILSEMQYMQRAYPNMEW